MKVQIEESWQQRLQDEFDKPYFEKLVMFVKSEYKKAHVLPPGKRNTPGLVSANACTRSFLNPFSRPFQVSTGNNEDFRPYYGEHYHP